MTRKLYVPVRIDPFGGLTDLEEFRSQLGCNLVNIAIDIYDEKDNKKGIFFDTTQTKKPSVLLIVNGVQVDSISNINTIYQYKDPTISGTAKLFRSLFFNLFSRSTLRNCLLERDLFKELPFGLKIEITNTIPISSGLGTSGAFCAGIYEILYKFFESSGMIQSISDYKEMGWKIIYESEVLLSQMEAGFQDQVAAFYGGITHLYSDPGISDNRVFRNQLRMDSFPDFSGELQRNSILIYSPREKISSDTLLSIKATAENNRKDFYQFLKTVKKRQSQFYSYLLSQQKAEKEVYLEFAKGVKACWEAQYKILPKIASPLARYVSKQKFSLLGFRECGAGGGGCILLLFPPNNKHKDILNVFEQCKQFQSDICLYKLKPNNTGLSCC